jgi:hypothetical protein
MWMKSEKVCDVRERLAQDYQLESIDSRDWT